MVEIGVEAELAACEPDAGQKFEEMLVFMMMVGHGKAIPSISRPNRTHVLVDQLGQ